MHSLRGGTVAGVHEVSFFGQDEEVTLTHRANEPSDLCQRRLGSRAEARHPANPASIRSTRSCLPNGYRIHPKER